MGFLRFSGALAGSRYPATPQSRSSSPLPIRQRAGVLFEIAIRSLCQGPRQPRTDPAGGATAALRQRYPANARSAFVRTAGGANGANAPPDRGFLLGGLSNASTFWVTRNRPLDKIRNVPDRWLNALDCDLHFRDRCLLPALGYRLAARPIQGHALPSGGV